MPALVCLSPVLADQSFPRYSKDAKTVAIALGELAQLTESGIIRVATTPVFRDLLEAYCWEQPTGLKGEIYNYLNRLVLGGGPRTVAVNVSKVTNYVAHPTPVGCDDNETYVQLWADDIGKLLVIHDDCIAERKYFIGVACEHAFSGKQISSYKPHSHPRCFPLVSPSTSDCNSSAAALVDADEFNVSGEFENADVSFEEAKQNVYAIGASAVHPPDGGSHFTVKFPGARTWPLDSNYDPVPPQYLNQLKHITGLPMAAIKCALKTGKLPTRQLRLKQDYLA